jgi:hypothetical protein
MMPLTGRGVCSDDFFRLIFPAGFYAKNTAARDLRHRIFMGRASRIVAMKIPSASAALMTRRIRCIGLIAISLLFLISVFQLIQLPTASSHKGPAHCGALAEAACDTQPLAGNGLINMWRGLALGSLYLFFCLQPRRSVQPRWQHPASFSSRQLSIAVEAMPLREVPPGQASPSPVHGGGHGNGRSMS